MSFNDAPRLAIFRYVREKKDIISKLDGNRVKERRRKKKKIEGKKEGNR